MVSDIRSIHWNASNFLSCMSGVPINLKRNQGKTKFGFLLFELIAEYIREDTHGGACMTGIADALSGGAC